jgi:hypothetical protein
MSPPVAAGVGADATVVVVVGADAAVVVVVGADDVVVVLETVPPPPLAPPPEPALPPLGAPPVLTVGVVAAGTVMGEVIVAHRFARPRKKSGARLSTTSVRADLTVLGVSADAEASMLTIVTSRQDETANVTILGIRCVVFAWKSFLSVPLCMKYKFAVSGHVTANESSKATQLCLKCLRMHAASQFYAPLGIVIFLAQRHRCGSIGEFVSKPEPCSGHGELLLLPRQLKSTTDLTLVRALESLG